MIKIVSFNPENKDKFENEEKNKNTSKLVAENLADDLLDADDLGRLKTVNETLESLTPEEFNNKLKLMNSIGENADLRTYQQYLYQYQGTNHFDLIMLVINTPIEVFNTKPSFTRALLELTLDARQRYNEGHIEYPIDIEKYKNEIQKVNQAENEKQPTAADETKEDTPNKKPQGGLRIVR